jgi:hypothetical protein
MPAGDFFLLNYVGESTSVRLCLHVAASGEARRNESSIAVKKLGEKFQTKECLYKAVISFFHSSQKTLNNNEQQFIFEIYE